MRLFILRHGDAVEAPAFRDRDRPLSDLGKRQIQALAHFFQVSKQKPDLILTSPLERARQTCDILRNTLKVQDAITLESLASGASLKDVLADINAHPVQTLLVVGHEPQMSGLVSILTGGDEQFRVEMKKASLACLEVRHPVRNGHAVLSWLLPSDLTALFR